MPGNLNNIIENFRFNLVEKEMAERIKEFRERMVPYTDLFIVARQQVDYHTKMELENYGIKEVLFIILLGNREILRTSITYPIFEDKTPLEYQTEKTKQYKNTSMTVWMGKELEEPFSNEHKINRISKEVLMKVREDPSVQEQRKEREYLINECKSLIESIEKKIVL